MKTQKMDVTPQMAAKWLSHNDGNRKLRDTRVKYFAEAMNRGEWQLTHQGLAIASTGRLIDGQHRLRAIILSGKTVPMLVTTDVEEKTYKVLDAGQARTMADRLQHDDANKTQIVTSMWRYVAPTKMPHEYEVELMLESFGDAIDLYESLREDRAGKKPRATAAAACVLALAASKGTRRAADVREAARRIINNDLVNAPPVFIQYYKHVTIGAQTGGKAVKRRSVEPRKDVFCRTWICMDPKHANDTRLVIKDHDSVITQMKAAFNAVTEGVFA